MRRTLTLVASLLLAVSLHGEAAPPKKPAAKAPIKAAAPKPATGSPTAAAIPLLKQGLAALQNKQTAQAEQAFKKALSLMGPSDPNQIVAVNNLARLYHQQDRYPEALTFAKKALPLNEKRYGANSLQMADAIYLMANIQHLTHDASNAETNYRRSLAIYELPPNLGKASQNYTTALENMGILAAQAKTYDKALFYYQKALAARKQHPEVNNGTLLENIGILHQNQEKRQEATQYYEQALAALEQNPAANQEAIKRVSFKLANIKGQSIQTGRTTGQATGQYDGQFYTAAQKAFNIDRNYAEAARLYQLALDQATQYYPKEQRFILQLESALGRALYYADDIDAAIPHLEKVHAAQITQLKANDPELLNTVVTLGLVYNGKGDYALAQKHLLQAKSHSTPGTPSYGPVLTALADTQCHQGNFQECKMLYDEALTIYTNKGPDGAQQVKSIQYQLALLDKMFKSRQGIEELISYSKAGLRRWSMENKPIYIFLSSGSHLPNWNERHTALMQRAFQEWQTALPGQAHFAYTDTPDKADVLVTWTDHPIEQSDVEAKVGLHKLSTIRSFFRSSEIIICLKDEEKSRTDRELYVTALHEIGHMLGLQHSSNLSDVMAAVGNYAIPAQGWPTLSASDIQAARLLYQKTPAITNPPGITLAEYRKFDEIAKPGIDALRAHQYKHANRIFEQARALYTQDPYINYFSGLSAFQAGDYKDAREIFENLPMPQSTEGFSVDSQLGLIYVELGHKYNKWGRKNKATSNEFYEKGVIHLQKALQSPQVPASQREYLSEKLREGINRRQEPTYTWEFSSPMYRRF